jgi:hypothetical protein
MLFEQYVLPVVGLVGVLVAIGYGLWGKRQDHAAALRKEAFGEAHEALMSLANIAAEAHEYAQREGRATGQAATRAYYYSRAAQIVASIPVERL